MAKRIEQHPHATPLSEQDAQKQARTIKALADPTRLRLVRLLALYKGNLTVIALTEKLDVAQSTVSHHLLILSNAGIVESRKVLQYAHYSLCVDGLAHIHALIDGLTGDCTHG
jgi:ArsR family transcriptional regulator, arsenate/arsenite/antimonite-responsive transcriptional repressor